MIINLKSMHGCYGLMSIKHIDDSVSYSVFGRAAEMAAKGRKVYPLAIGEPSFQTPKAIVEKAHEAMETGNTHYVSSFGIPEVRDAIKDKVRERNKINAEIPNVMYISTKLSVYASIIATAGAGDEVLIPNPGYFYHQPTTLAGASPIWYELAEDYSLDMDVIRKKTTEKTKAIIVNTPSNPTGKMFGKEELKELLEFCNGKKIRIISDESYEDLVYSRLHVSIGSLEPVPSTVISLFSLSKSFAMTGWRAGYTVADKQVIRTMVKFIEHTLSCFPPFIQFASAYALRNEWESTAKFREELRKRKGLMEGMMERIPRLHSTSIEGAFYAFPRYDARIDSVDFSQKLLESKGVAVLPGRAFGPAGEGHVRISFAAPRETIEGGMQLLGEFLDGLPPEGTTPS